MPKSKSQVRRSPEEWRALVEVCDQSGLSRRAFVEREGLQPHTFAWWSTRLSPKQSRATRAPRGVALAPAHFVPVRVSAGRGQEQGRAARRQTEVAEATPTIEVVLSNGRRVRCSLAHAGDPRLVALLSAAEGGGGC